MGLSIYDPKGDSYSRLFGLEESSFTIDFEWFTWEKSSSEEIVLYGLVKEVNCKVYKKDSKDYECKNEPVKFSLHAKEYESYKKKITPKCHESFFFWFLSNLEKGCYSGSLKFSTELDSVYGQIRKKELVGDVEDNGTLSIVVNIQKITLDTEPSKPNMASYTGKGKSFVSKFQQAKEMFPEYFKDCEKNHFEGLIDHCLNDLFTPQGGIVSMKARDRQKNKATIALCVMTNTPLDLGTLKNPSYWDKETPVIERSKPVEQVALEAIDRKQEQELDFPSMYVLINTYCEALGITNEERKATVERLYGKKHLTLLTDEEIRGFVQILEDDLNAG